MKHIDGVYKVDLLGPFGWESFSTAFINEGKYRSASAHHFTSGTYETEDGGFEMEGNLTQYVVHRPLFGRNNIKGLPIKFSGRIHDDIIDGEARVADGNGNQRWELDKGATLHDVTHLGCRSARYTPASSTTACSPAQAPRSVFRVSPGEPMPPVAGCNKQDYAVLFIIAVGADS